jgi:cell division protein FtsB
MYRRQQTSWLGEHWGVLALAAVFLAALAFGGWGIWQVFAPVSGDPRAQISSLRRDNAHLQDEAEQLRQRVATLTRSDQISRDANRDLQGAIADRDEEIAGLRADVAFYERLVGATAQRHGLAVHALKLQQQAGAAWHFTTTLTQNLNRGAVSDGTLTLTLEGTRGGKLQRLSWGDLRQQPSAPGVAYSFKYFQQVEGDVFVPADLTPVKVTVRLQPRSGAAIEQSFTWAAALRGQTVAE